MCPFVERYIYHSLFAFFDRDNVGLPGLAQYFKESSDEEREHAEKLMYQQVCRFQLRHAEIIIIRSSALVVNMAPSLMNPQNARYSMALAISSSARLHGKCTLDSTSHLTVNGRQNRLLQTVHHAVSAWRAASSEP